MTTISVGISVGAAGPQPTPPAVINANYINLVAGIDTGYTVLPGGLIEDLSSTATYAIALCDSAAVDLINSVSPLTANPWLLVLQGQLYGVPQGVNTNGSVFAVFSGTVGFIVSVGFTISDGNHQYTVVDGGIVGSDGNSLPLFCVATQPGTFPIPANSVQTLITSVPSEITLTVNNPNTGTPSAGAQTQEDYRAQVLQAGIAPATGCASLAKTLIANVPGVQPRLVSILQVDGGGWEVIVGGGDPYLVAFAVYQSGLDISSLVGSTIAVTEVTNASPGVVTTNLNHGLVTGQANVHIAGVQGMTGVNGGPYTVTVIDATHFSFGVNTTSSGTYVSGGSVTPNARNISTNLNDYPDVYTVPTVNPPQQAVTVQLTWNTNSPNAVSDSAVAQLGAPAIANYINSIAVGTPINEFELDAVFQAAVISLIPTPFLTRLVWTISIDGIETPVTSGTGIVVGDPESFFFCQSNNVTITQG